MENTDVTIRTRSTRRNRQTIKITICEGDIAKQETDVIVNSTSRDLDLKNGAVSAAILAQGGTSLQAECRTKYPNGIQMGNIARTSGHDLSCKEVFHVAIDNFKSANSEENLLNIVLQCLEETSLSQYTSIAFPALGSGILGYPRNVVSRTMIKAFNHFRTATTSTSISDIYVVIWKDPQTIKEFQTEMRKSERQIPERSTSLSRDPDDVALRVFSSYELSISGKSKDVTIRTRSTRRNRQTIKITICEGDIAKQETDVIVNSTSRDLNLKNGAVSAAILTQGGTSLQAECRRKYPNGIQIGNIARTSGHDLSCKEVFHVAIDNFKNSGDEENILNIVLQCLEEASQSQYTSIAFPALGSGVLGYPRNVVSRTMIKAFNHFRTATTSTSISDIYVVIWKDPQTIKEFQTENINSGMQIPDRSPSFSRDPDDLQLRRFSSHELSASSEDVERLTKYTGYFECKIDGLRLLVKQGDITEEVVDAIVNSSNDAFDLSIGSVSLALKSKCGKDLVVECEERVSEMQAKGVCVTSAFNMKCRHILHVSSNRFHTNWQAGIKAILKEAEGLGINTIAFPALGTGGYNVTSEILAEAMFRALIRFYKSHTDTELEVRVVLFDSDLIHPFVSQIEAQVTSAKVKTTKLWKRTLFKGKSDASSLSKLITTNNSLQETPHVSAEGVTKMLEGAKAPAVPFAEEIIEYVQTKYDQYPLSEQMEVSGIYEELRESSISSGNLSSVWLNKKTNYGANIGIPVHALPKIKSTLPTSWADQGRDKKVQRCSLSKSDKEFKTVEKNFRASLGKAKINIVTIERIQNPELYMHYMIKKTGMENQNADIPGIANEKTLWHGTDGKAISKINHNGFNRSCCGKNATVFGEGVYFAVSSEYSASPKYSPPDSKGRRHIYQCKVLTGQAIIGKDDLKVLPPRSGDILYDSATNNLTEPTVYVIFNDNQAYPEYLITFTD